MKKLLKKLTAILLTLLMMTTTVLALPFTASAAKEEESVSAASGTTGDCIWTVDDEGTLTISGNGTMGNYAQPCSEPWYINKIKRAVIENGVTNIGLMAFFYCTSLESVSIPDSVTGIDDGAFQNCTSLKKIKIPGSVTTIKDNAFWHCTSLHEITFTNGLTNIKSEAFLGCTSLTTVNIPDSVTFIDESAFDSCTNLVGITIPESVIEIGDEAFLDCPNLTIYGKKGTCAENYANLNNIPFTDIEEINSYGKTGECKWVLTNDGTLTISGNGTMGNYDYIYFLRPWQSCCKAIIEDGVTNIGTYAFLSCSDLTSITIPNSVTSIGDHAFEYCDNLTNVVIPDSVTGIGNYAFGRCYSLTNITIPDSITNIGDYVFYLCRNLESITIPDSVTSISDNSFKGCKNLTIYGKKNSCAETYANSKNNPFVALKKIIANGTTGDCNWELDDEGTLTISGNGAMSDYSYSSSPWPSSELHEVIIEDGVTRIGSYAFSYCFSLTNITIPNSVTRIGSAAFYSCTNLTSITIPDSVTNIGKEAFSGCQKLSSIIVDEQNMKYDSRNNCNAIIETKSNCLIQGCNNTVIPDSVTSIGDYAFYKCTGLTSITIPDSVTNIGDYAFYHCTNLTSITIPDSVTNIGKEAFSGCIKLSSIIVDEKNVKYDSRNNCNAIIETESNCLIQGCNNTVIPNSVTSIGEEAFFGCSGLTSITIPDSVTSIGDYAFYDCTGLTSITIPDGVTRIGGFAFYYCTRLTSITIPNSVTSIESCAFDHCIGLTSITIPNSVTSIGSWAFNNCTNLTSITIPDSVTSIGRKAFYHCIGLTSITIPDSVTNIGYRAFDNTIWYDSQPDGVVYVGKVAYCYKGAMPEHTSITLKEGTVGIAERAFRDFKELDFIEIPDSVKYIGWEAFFGCENLDFVNIPDSVIDIGYHAFNDTAWYKKQDEGVVYAGSAACDYKVGASTPEPSTITLKSGTRSITQGAFFGCNIEKITIPNTVTKIGSYAFANCLSLKSVTIPPSVKSIGEKAFGYYSENAKIEDFMDFDKKNFEIYKTADNEGIKIQGTKNSKAENYAKENKFSFTESIDYNYQFEWEKDNWGFDNVHDSVSGASIDEDTVKKLAEILNIENWEYLKKELDNISDNDWNDYWIGSCFGMTVAEILVKQGLLSLTDYGVGNISNALPTDKDEKNKLITLISVLQELQNYGVYAQSNRSGAYSSVDSSPTIDEGSQNSGTTSITQKNFIEKIEEELKTTENEGGAKKNHSVILIEYSFKDFNMEKKGEERSHAVLGYGIESGSYEYNDKTYDHRILIADPNWLTYKDGNKKFDDACIYYNSSNGHWICPYWNENNRKCFWDGNVDEKNKDIDPGHIISLIKYNSLTDPEFYPEVSKDYIAGLTIFNPEGNQEVFNFKEDQNEKVKIDDYKIVNQLDDRKFYALDNTKVCSFSYNEPSDYSMMMDYENVSYFAKVENGKSTTVKPSGCINLEGDKIKYSLTMMTNNSNNKSDWYSITVSGSNTNNVTLTKREDGYLIKTDSSEDSLGYITITAKNNSGKITVAYNTQSSSAIIKKDENNIAVMVNSNEDGDYDKKLSPMGDVNGNGVVDINDVTAIQYHLAELETLNDNQLAFADVNGNGAFDINDATQLQKNLAGLTG